VIGRAVDVLFEAANGGHRRSVVDALLGLARRRRALFRRPSKLVLRRIRDMRGIISMTGAAASTSQQVNQPVRLLTQSCSPGRVLGAPEPRQRVQAVSRP
jgi:hypothetical protein